MTDDDDLFEREMASMGLGPSASSIRAREDRAFIEEVVPAEEAVLGGVDPTQGEDEPTVVNVVESPAEAARIFEEAMGELWDRPPGEAPETLSAASGASPDPVTRSAIPEGSPPPRPPEESDTESGRLFEEAIRGLTTAPVKESDRPAVEPEPDPWSESTESIKRMIRKGRLRHESELDLHGMTQREARETVESYLANSAISGVRMVRIVCGRGLHSRSGSMLLRDTLPTWLQVDFETWVARAFRAPRELGGEGAWYVILRRP